MLCTLVLHEILKEASSKVSVSTSVLQSLVNKELEKLGFGSVCIPAVGPGVHAPEGDVVQEACRSAESRVQCRGGG